MNYRSGYRMVEGRGKVKFNPPDSLNTSAAFTLYGDYVIRLMASDGELISWAEKSIQVFPPAAKPEKQKPVRLERTSGPRTSIHYELKNKGPVRVTLFDCWGRELIVLENTEKAAGSYQLDWVGNIASGKIAASGIYIVEIKTQEFTRRQKVVLVK